MRGGIEKEKARACPSLVFMRYRLTLLEPVQVVVPGDETGACLVGAQRSARVRSGERAVLQQRSTETLASGPSATLSCRQAAPVPEPPGSLHKPRSWSHFPTPLPLCPSAPLPVSCPTPGHLLPLALEYTNRGTTTNPADQPSITLKPLSVYGLRRKGPPTTGSSNGWPLYRSDTQGGRAEGPRSSTGLRTRRGGWR